MYDDVAAFCRRQVDDGTLIGVVALRGGPDAVPVAAGALERGGAPMPADAVFRIQSMTKLVSAVATLRLVEAGRLGLDDPVARWLPELAEPRVLRSPDAELDDVVAATGPITVRHLLTCTSGYGMIISPTPLGAAMAANGTEAGPDPVAYGADEWLARLAALPLSFQPGQGWRYHHSFGILGVLLSRLTGGPLGDHLADDLFEPLGMVDTGPRVPEAKRGRLPAAYREEGEDLVETEPAAGGFYVGEVPPFDVSHAELVSTATDYHRFLTALLAGRLVSPEHLAELSRDQIPAQAKAADSFFPGFFDHTSWGYGVGVQEDGAFGWSGGLGTTFTVFPDRTVGILMTQVEMGPRMFPVTEAFEKLTA